MCKTRTAYANTKHSTEDVIVDEERGEEEGDESEYYNIYKYETFTHISSKRNF